MKMRGPGGVNVRVGGDVLAWVTVGRRDSGAGRGDAGTSGVTATSVSRPGPGRRLRPRGAPPPPCSHPEGPRPWTLRWKAPVRWVQGRARSP